MSAQETMAKPALKVVPILPSLDFAQTRDFYVGNLGFEEVEFACDDYLVIHRGGLELQFWLSDDPFQCQNSSVFFRSEAVRDIYRDLCDRGIEAVVPRDTHGEPTRFHVRDPHGNLLMFGGSPLRAAAH
ncbi:VOC family protein [Rhizobium glycinendophyticum]|uniref:Glyoxalase n=1 Tax=Rhizobium glycinendophyticum TaxID=2589807 RepID=A0A504UYE2_9HYPH|nr:VOC family protein [Rhizobium glycinendophyticum]TPP11791.1 glyoxalase [Rhizobium glycinendophyticum]